jgi:NitT/TauT family transport system ATP-binding protein
MAQTIELQNVYVNYAGRDVLTDFSCVFPSGITCIMGPSGVGKTTLARVAAGLVTPQRGKVTGADGLRFSYVFQENRLLPGESVLTNVNFPLREPSPDAAELLQAVGLAEDMHKRARELSGGMARRAELVRALLLPFDVLILDEPFAGLDDDTKAQAAALIRKRTQGKTVLCITHDSEDATTLGAGVLNL